MGVGAGVGAGVRARATVAMLAVLFAFLLQVGCSSLPVATTETPEAINSADVAAATAVSGDAELPSLIGPPTRAAREPGVTGERVGIAGILPPGWEPWILHPSKAKTQYRLERLDIGMAMRADADASASGLLCRTSSDPARRPILEWRWRVDSLITGADNTDRHAEDAPVRVVLAFDGDKSTLSLKDRMFFETVRVFSGRDMPYATLMYIWENNKPVGSIIRNPNTERVRKVVVASGPMGLQEWQSFRRNIVDDYKLAYGVAPGKLIGVAILTDTDNTKQKVTAWYGDIKLLRK